MRSRRAWVRLASLGGCTLGWKVAGGCGGSIGPQAEEASGELPPVKVGEENDDEGVVGKGLSGEGVRGTASSGGTFGFSERKCPSMTMFVVDKGIGLLTEKVEDEPTRNMGGGVDLWES